MVDIPEEEFELSLSSANILAGKTRKDLTAKGEIESSKTTWKVADTGIVTYDANTRTLKGIKPGVTTVTATYGNVSKTCYVRCVYPWKKNWITKKNSVVPVSLISGSGFKSNGTIPANTSMDGFWEKQRISKGQVIGKIGNTGNSGGYHLHFEVNNKELNYSSAKNPNSEARNFGNSINPIFFFIDYYLSNSNKINQNCEAMKYKGPFWYGDNESTKGS